MEDLISYCGAQRKFSNDHAWLHEYLKPRPVPSEDPVTLKLFWTHCTETESSLRSENIPITRQGTTVLSHRLDGDLSTLRAVVLCHGQSADVDGQLVTILTEKLGLESAFIRQHLDYRNFRHERNCQADLQNLLRTGTSRIPEFKMRWKPVKLPSESCGKALKIGMDDDCMSFCLSKNIAVILIRSLRTCTAEHWSQGESDPRLDSLHRKLAQRYLVSLSFTDHMDDSGHPWVWVYHYARLLLLEHYADYMYAHDPELLKEVYRRDDDHWLEMNQKCLELECLHQDLSAFVGSSDTPLHQGIEERIAKLALDAAFLLKRYDRAYTAFGQRCQYTIQNDQEHVMAEQLEEARESKLTAVSVGRLSKLAFIFIPPTFVCTMLGMNLKVFGQGTVSVTVFVILIISVSALTFVPTAFQSSTSRERLKKTLFQTRTIMRLAWSSPVAAFWYNFFLWDHSGDIVECFGYCAQRQLYDRKFFEYYKRQVLDARLRGTWASDEYWRDKVRGHVFPLFDEPGWEKRSLFSRCWRAHQAKSDSPC